jgi:hypothetical protein
MRTAHLVATVALFGLLPGCGDDGAGSAQGLTADDIPVAHTPPGGFGDSFPEPVLAECTEPLVEGAPDLRGLWRTLRAEQLAVRRRARLDPREAASSSTTSRSASIPSEDLKPFRD